jgi:hypothetical protein
MAHPKATFTEERKTEVLGLIKAHLAEHGSKNYKPLMEACADIPQATIWTWIRKVKNDPPSQVEIRQAHDALMERATAAAAGELPTPPPALVAKTGVQRAIRKLDFAQEIEKLYADAEMLREFSVAVKTGEDGEPVEKIKNAHTFEKSIKSRASLIETSLKVLDELWNARTIQQFYGIIIEEIGRADLDTQKRILERLRVVNERHGMSLSMRL